MAHKLPSWQAKRPTIDWVRRNLSRREVVDTTTQLLLHLLLLAGGVAMLMPFIWMLSTSFKPLADIFRTEIELIPRTFTLEHYVTVWTTAPFGRYLLNTLGVSLAILAGQILTIVPAAYVFAKRDFRGRNALFGIFMTSMMIPFHVTMLPNYMTLAKFGWIDSYAGLVVPFLTSAFGIFLLRQFFMSVPNSLLDAARIDGCSEFQIMWLVLVRCSFPALAAFSIFSFVRHWNAYFWPLIIIETRELATVTLGLVRYADFESHGIDQYGTLMAASTLSVLPVVLLFLLLQRYFIEGIATTGVKG